jgi:thymidylate synthase
MIADAHIYDRHIPVIKELIARETFAAPKFTLNPDKTDFYEFTRDDVKVEGYEFGQEVKNIRIAI